ncbi:MAG: restriction endonuclease subunit S [Methanosarcina sp.]|uniref:restriction endonuclease subunit S n=1 Tax=Methanosarcina sp. TaxID=2213 RepID=UPI00262E844F|nr:restriction endonuclease subunit S [Methanosarcina sp.]MDD3245720.1 restriction endonuclease subunit S [Methanosarcina sp.]
MSVASSKLQNDWPVFPLGKLCGINIGRTPSRDRSEYWGLGYPWLSIADMNQGRYLEITKENITDLAVRECNCRLVPVGTVLLSFKLSIGKVGISRIPLFTNEAIAALPISDSNKLSSDYLYWALQSIDLKCGLDRAAKGLTLNKAKLVDIEIPLPPLPEQKRIADILDRAEALRAKRRAALAQLEELTQAIFIDMFGDPAVNPKEWLRTKLGDVIFSASDGPHVSPKYTENGVPFLSTRHVRAGEITWEDLKFISKEDAEIQWRKCKPERGDILYTKGGTTGLAATVKTDQPFAIWVHVSLLKPDPEKVDSIWLESMLNNEFCYRQSQVLTHGIANRDLGLTRMVKIKIFHPPLPLQQEFSRRVTAVEKLKAVHKASLAELDELFASLQYRAFGGEL